MKVYIFKKFSRIQRVLADENAGYLTWPGTNIPYLDQDALSASPDKDRLDALLNLAEESEKACAELWQNPAILDMTLKVADSVH